MTEAKVVFPEWGKYGIRIELKPPNERFRNPKLLISEVAKDETAMSGWKFYMRAFNEAQKGRGFYNAHCSIPVDSIPLVIATLVEIWDEIKPADAPNVTDHTRDIARIATTDEHHDEMFRESKDMAELHSPDPNMPSPSKPTPAKPIDTAEQLEAALRKDPWDAVRKKKGGPVVEGENDENSGDPGDFIPF